MINEAKQAIKEGKFNLVKLIYLFWLLKIDLLWALDFYNLGLILSRKPKFPTIYPWLLIFSENVGDDMPCRLGEGIFMGYCNFQRLETGKIQCTHNSMYRYTVVFLSLYGMIQHPKIGGQLPYQTITSTGILRELNCILKGNLIPEYHNFARYVY